MWLVAAVLDVTTLGQRSAQFSVKDQIMNILGFGSHVASGKLLSPTLAKQEQS